MNLKSVIKKAKSYYDTYFSLRPNAKDRKSIETRINKLISDKRGLSQAGEKMKKPALFLFKALSSACVAFVIALIGQQFISYKLFSFVFIMLSVGLAVFQLLKDYKFYSVLLVDLLLILFAVLLRLYVISSSAGTLALSGV